MSVDSVFVVGAYSTKFGKHTGRSFQDLARESLEGAINDAGGGEDAQPESIWFGCTRTGGWPRPTNVGQMCLWPIIEAGIIEPHTPIFNVENACATGSQAFNGAVKDVLSGQAEMSVAIGVEKINNPHLSRADVLKAFNGEPAPEGDVQDCFSKQNEAAYAAAAEFAPAPVSDDSQHSVFMDTYAIQARVHMKQFGTTVEQIASGAAKNHCYGALNEKAQYRFNMTLEEVLADRMVSFPLTRAMCAPIGDGAAAVLVCSESSLKGMPDKVRERAVRVAASAFSSGSFRSLEAPSLSRVAAERAFNAAGLTAKDIDVAEVHDATAFCEVYQAEMLGFCGKGEGGAFVEAGETGPGGSVPINTSGGLVSKGHPIAATGLSMLFELTQQLRGEAGERQVSGARVALQENGGGVMGLEEAACSVAILVKD